MTSIWGRFIRRPPLTLGRMFGLSSFAAFTGASIGTGFQVRSSIQAVNSLENPDRFKKALVETSQEVIAQRQAALRRASGQPAQQPPPQDGEHTKLADGWDSGKFQQPPSPPGSAAPGMWFLALTTPISRFIECANSTRIEARTGSLVTTTSSKTNRTTNYLGHDPPDP